MKIMEKKMETTSQGLGFLSIGIPIFIPVEEEVY